MATATFTKRPPTSLSVSLSVAAVAPKVKCQCSQLCPSPSYPVTPCPSPYLPTSNNAKPPTKATPVTFFCLFFVSPVSFFFFFAYLAFCCVLIYAARHGQGTMLQGFGPQATAVNQVTCVGVEYKFNPRTNGGREENGRKVRQNDNCTKGPLKLA